jgi:hypothetical protein
MRVDATKQLAELLTFLQSVESTRKTRGPWVIAVGDPTKQGNFDLDLRDLAPAKPSVTGTADQGEKVYLFHTTASPQWSRDLFLQYLRQASCLRDDPR